MTGRDLIVYILENGLENEEVYKDGKLLGFMTAEELAVKFGVGVQTVYAWFMRGDIDGTTIDEGLYIPANTKNPMERNKDEKTVTNVTIVGNNVTCDVQQSRIIEHTQTSRTRINGDCYCRNA